MFVDEPVNSDFAGKSKPPLLHCITSLSGALSGTSQDIKTPLSHRG